MSTYTTAERAAMHESLARLNPAELRKAQTAVGALLESVSVTVSKEAEGMHSGNSGAACDARARKVEIAQTALLKNVVALAPKGLPGPLGRMLGAGTETLTALKTGATAYLAAAWRLKADYPAKEWGLEQDWLPLPAADATQAQRVEVLEGYELSIPFFPLLPEAPGEVQRAAAGGGGSYGLSAGAGGGGGGAGAADVAQREAVKAGAAAARVEAKGHAQKEGSMPQPLATAMLTAGTPEAKALKTVAERGSKAMANSLVNGTLPGCVVALLVCSDGARSALTGSQDVEKVKAYRPMALRALCGKWVEEMVVEKDGWEQDDADNEELVQLTASMLEGRTDLATCEVLARVVYQKVLKASTVPLSEEEGDFFRLPAKSREEVPSSLGLSPKTARLMSKIWAVVYMAVAPSDVEQMRALFERHHKLLSARLNAKLGTVCKKTSMKLQDGIRRAFAHIRAGESPTLALGVAPAGKAGVFEEQLAAFKAVKEMHDAVVPSLRVTISHQAGKTPHDAYALKYNRLAVQAEIWGERPDELEQDSWSKRQKTVHHSPHEAQSCRDFAAGRCVRGAACKFAHSSTQLTPGASPEGSYAPYVGSPVPLSPFSPVGFQGQQPTQRQQQQQQQQHPGAPWQAHFGARPCVAQQQQQRQQQQQQQQQQQPQQQQQEQQGQWQGQQQGGLRQACKYFARGHCAAGNACQFLHVPTSTVSVREGCGARAAACGVAGGGVPPGGVGRRAAKRPSRLAPEARGNSRKGG